MPECLTGEISCTGGIPDTKEEREKKNKKKKAKTPPNQDGRSGSAPAGAPRYNYTQERDLFTNAEIAALLRKERVKQILDGKFDLTNPYELGIEEITERGCRRGARDGCGAANLAKDLMDWLGRIPKVTSRN